MVPIISIYIIKVMVFVSAVAPQGFRVCQGLDGLLSGFVVLQMFWLLLVVILILSEFGVLSRIYYICFLVFGCLCGCCLFFI